MKLNDYQIAALRTAPEIQISEFHESGRLRSTRDLLHGAAGLCSNAGALIEAYMSYSSADKPVDWEKVVELTSAALYSIAILTRAAGVPMEEIARRSLAIGSQANRATDSACQSTSAPKKQNTTGTDLKAFWEAQSEWSQRTFGTDAERGPKGALKHLAKEVNECLADPTDLMEFVDCLFLVCDASRRAGFTVEQVMDAAWEKLAINKARQWQKPTSGDEPVEHVR